MHMRITSRDNRHIKDIIKLCSNGRSRKENGLFVVEGVRICTDAADSHVSISTLLISDTAEQKYKQEIARLSVVARQVISTTDAVFAKVADTKNPQGILAVCETPKLRLDVQKINRNGQYVALENLSDPANLGTIARTAEALGIDGIILSSGSCDPYSPKALRAGMGSLIRIPLLQSQDFFADLEQFRKAGLSVFAAVPDRTAKSISEMCMNTGAVILIGNEGNGLTDIAKEYADKQITIPMAGRAESLNAAAAASIMMWEMVRK